MNMTAKQNPVYTIDNSDNCGSSNIANNVAGRALPTATLLSLQPPTASSPSLLLVVIVVAAVEVVPMDDDDGCCPVFIVVSTSLASIKGW